MNEIANALKALDEHDWDGAHRIVQDIDTPMAAWLHGVLHLIEGDEPNSQYWFRLADRPFPGRAKIKDEIQLIRNACGA